MTCSRLNHGCDETTFGILARIRRGGPTLNRRGHERPTRRAVGRDSTCERAPIGFSHRGHRNRGARRRALSRCGNRDVHRGSARTMVDRGSRGPLRTRDGGDVADGRGMAGSGPLRPAGPRGGRRGNGVGAGRADKRCASLRPDHAARDERARGRRRGGLRIGAPPHRQAAASCANRGRPDRRLRGCGVLDRSGGRDAARRNAPRPELVAEASLGSAGRSSWRIPGASCRPDLLDRQRRTSTAGGVDAPRRVLEDHGHPRQPGDGSCRHTDWPEPDGGSAGTGDAGEPARHRPERAEEFASAARRGVCEQRARHRGRRARFAARSMGSRLRGRCARIGSRADLHVGAERHALGALPGTVARSGWRVDGPIRK